LGGEVGLGRAALLLLLTSISYTIYTCSGRRARGLGMAKDKRGEPTTPKPLAWLHGEIKTPPSTKESRKEAGYLLRLLQQGENIGMPQAEPLPIVGPRCGALRVRDGAYHWRIMFRADPDAVLIVEVYAKKTRKIP